MCITLIRLRIREKWRLIKRENRNMLGCEGSPWPSGLKHPWSVVYLTTEDTASDLSGGHFFLLSRVRIYLTVNNPSSNNETYFIILRIISSEGSNYEEKSFYTFMKGLCTKWTQTNTFWILTYLWTIMNLHSYYLWSYMHYCEK